MVGRRNLCDTNKMISGKKVSFRSRGPGFRLWLQRPQWQGGVASLLTSLDLGIPVCKVVGT